MEKDYKKRLQKYEDLKNKFWKEEYPKKSREEKIKYWSGSLHQQMRWNGESGYDEMAVFSEKDYKDWEIKEPDIGELLPDILKKLNISKDKVYPLLGLEP